MPAPNAARAVRRANVAAAIVIVLAGALSAAWVFIVPIFQATDEAAHFDYAISILTEGHLIGTSGTHVGWIVSPYTRYLLGASDYFRIAFHSSMRVPPGYGTLTYFRRVDGGAARLANVSGPPGEISYIAAAYPFGFYALEAAWMKLISLATGSLVAMFFGARLLCVALTMLGLYFNYRTALNIGIPRWTSVALLGATAFFPLTLLVSSYVQPDNLAYCLVSASLFLATELRRPQRQLVVTAALGLVLGALAVTKYHFFLSVAIPTGLFVLAQISFERVTAATAAARILLLSIPTVALVWIQFALATPAYAKSPSSGLLASTVQMLQAGVEPTIAHLLTNVPRAFIDFFVTGPNAATYWGELGLWDTPLTVINGYTESLLRILISMASIAVFALIAYRLARNSVRLRAVAARKGVRRTAVIATSDPVLNSYVLLTAVMIALYVVTDNVFGAAGRQWYPFVFAPFFCTAWYAPRAIRVARTRGPAVIAVILLAYSLVSAGYATADIFQRYYGPANASYTDVVPTPSEIAGDSALGFLWPIQGMDFHPLATRHFRNTFLRGSRLWAGGAAIFPEQHSAATRVAVVVDGRTPARTVGGLYNFQIAEGARNLAYAYSGFFGSFGTSELAEGVHSVVAFAMNPKTGAFQQIPPARVFFLAPGAHFSNAFVHDLERAPHIGGELGVTAQCRAGLPLVTGSLSRPARSSDVVWLLFDGRPYPARLSDDERSFFGTIPVSEAHGGVYTVTAYLTNPDDGSYRRIAGQAALRVEMPQPKPKLAWIAPATPARCRDPLGLLAGT
jgi:hypothetical protein